MSERAEVTAAVRAAYLEGHGDAARLAEDAIRRTAVEAAEAVRVEANKHIAAAERRAEELEQLLRQVRDRLDRPSQSYVDEVRALIDSSALLDAATTEGK